MTYIAVINGNKVIGHATQDGKGRVCHTPELPLPDATDKRKPLFIKLPREIVDSGSRHKVNRKRTKAFSHRDPNLAGRRAVIWCDDDDRGFHSALIGTVFGAGTTTDGIGRNYTLKDCEIITKGEWNSKYAHQVRLRT
jgi:hypothetical protein